MKAARRHELKENELVRLLGDVRGFLQKHGTYVAGGVLIIVVVLAGGAMWRRSHQSKVMRAWDRHFALREETRGLSLGQEGDAQDALARMQSLAGSTEDSSLRLRALQSLAQFAWQYAVTFHRAGDEAEKGALLDAAAGANRDILAAFPDNVAACGTAQLALAKIEEENRQFERAREAYEAILSDDKYADSYTREAAADYLERLPSISTPIVFAPAPEPPPVPVAPEAGAPIEITPGASIKIPVTSEPPAPPSGDDATEMSWDDEEAPGAAPPPAVDAGKAATESATPPEAGADKPDEETGEVVAPPADAEGASPADDEQPDTDQ